MNRYLPRVLAVDIAVLGPLVVCCFADPNVIVNATATPEYTERKYSGERTTPETYVVMQGHYFEGGIVDKSIDRMPFRRIAEVFAPELARRQYWPARDAKAADLLIVVHWGTTMPRVSTSEMRARVSPLPNLSAVREDKQTMVDTALANQDPVMALLAGEVHEDNQLLQLARLDQISEQITNDYSSANTAQLLGYTKTLHQYGARMVSPEDEYSLRLDLLQMRYFIILRAYDLHAPSPAERSRAVWTLHLNVSSPGNNFHTAVASMSAAAVNYVGRSTDHVETVQPGMREGKVEIGQLVIIGEAK